MEVGWENFLMLVDNLSLSLRAMVWLVSASHHQMIHIDMHSLSLSLQWSGWSLFPIIK